MRRAVMRKYNFEEKAFFSIKEVVTEADLRKSYEKSALVISLSPNNLISTSLC